MPNHYFGVRARLSRAIQEFSDSGRWTLFEGLPLQEAGLENMETHEKKPFSLEQRAPEESS
jgi:hypothetical protein